jgi:hypothetical protein
MLTRGVEQRTVLKIQICFGFDSEAVKSDGVSRRVQHVVMPGNLMILEIQTCH